MSGWRSGNWNSTNPDVAAYIEREDNPARNPAAGWLVYGCYQDGGIMLTQMFPEPKFAPPLNDEPFASLEEAQKWAEENLPHPSNAPVEPNWDPARR